MTTSTSHPTVNRLLEAIIEHLDIPKSYYEKAVARHRSVAEWLVRDGSKVAAFKPDVSLQGSFRFGTVNRPLNDKEEYDLDNVCSMAVSKGAMTQKQLKELYGEEIKAYADAHGMEAAEEHNRCWRLPYADEVRFHLDTLPCIPEAADVIRAIEARGVPFDFASRAIAITDKRHPQYNLITSVWPTSNPRGFAAWFETHVRRAAQGRILELVARKSYRLAEDVPSYEWKTPLQRVIQILKRHRDVMFRENPELAPISMIITCLATHAYQGESDLATALVNVVDKMPQYINPSRPRVPNPTNPGEDYADKWASNPKLEENFRRWYTQLKVDVAGLKGTLEGGRLSADVHDIFRVQLTQDQIREFEAMNTPATTPAVRSAPLIHAAPAPRPWGSHA